MVGSLGIPVQTLKDHSYQYDAHRGESCCVTSKTPFKLTCLRGDKRCQSDLWKQPASQRGSSVEDRSQEGPKKKRGPPSPASARYWGVEGDECCTTGSFTCVPHADESRCQGEGFYFLGFYINYVGGHAGQHGICCVSGTLSRSCQRAVLQDLAGYCFAVDLLCLRVSRRREPGMREQVLDLPCPLEVRGQWQVLRSAARQKKASRSLVMRRRGTSF